MLYVIYYIVYTLYMICYLLYIMSCRYIYMYIQLLAQPRHRALNFVINVISWESLVLFAFGCRSTCTRIGSRCCCCFCWRCCFCCCWWCCSRSRYVCYCVVVILVVIDVVVHKSLLCPSLSLLAVRCSQLAVRCALLAARCSLLGAR